MSVLDAAIGAPTGAATQHAGGPRLKSGEARPIPQPREVTCDAEILVEAIASAAADPTNLLETKSVYEWFKHHKIRVTIRQELLVIDIQSFKKIQPGVFKVISKRAKVATTAVTSSVIRGKVRLAGVPAFFSIAYAVLDNYEEIVAGELARSTAQVTTGLAIGALASKIAQATVGAKLGSMVVVAGTAPAISGAVAVVAVGIVIAAGLTTLAERSGFIEALEETLRSLGNDLSTPDPSWKKGKEDFIRILENPSYTPALFLSLIHI